MLRCNDTGCRGVVMMVAWVAKCGGGYDRLAPPIGAMDGYSVAVGVPGSYPGGQLGLEVVSYLLRA